MPPTETYTYETRSCNHVVEIETTEDAFSLRGFRRYGGPPDPAGLCDGGDYIREISIRRNCDGTIRVRWQVAEWHRELGTPEHDYFDVGYAALFDVLWPHLVQVKAELKAAGKLGTTNG